jgi:hypothetical protein
MLYEQSMSLSWKCPRETDGSCACYKPDFPMLIFEDRPKPIVFVSESPFEYPLEGRASDPGEFLRYFDGQLRTRVWRNYYDAPFDIFEFILNTFRPTFEEPEGSLAEALQSMVYWTHGGKKTLLDEPYLKRREPIDRCLKNTFIRDELPRLKPEMMVVASSHVTRALFGHGLEGMYAWQSFVPKEDRKLSKIVTPSSPLYLYRREDWFLKCKVAIFPNPSPANAHHKKLAYSVGANQMHGNSGNPDVSWLKTTKENIDAVHEVIIKRLHPPTDGP